MIIGKLKPIEWFLEYGWEDRDNYIIDDEHNYGIDKRRFGRELELKEVEPEPLRWSLQDVNDLTYYKKHWFESLVDDGEDDEGEDLDEYGYHYQSSPPRGVR